MLASAERRPRPCRGGDRRADVAAPDAGGVAEGRDGRRGLRSGRRRFVPSVGRPGGARPGGAGGTARAQRNACHAIHACCAIGESHLCAK